MILSDVQTQDADPIDSWTTNTESPRSDTKRMTVAMLSERLNTTLPRHDISSLPSTPSLSMPANVVPAIAVPESPSLSAHQFPAIHSPSDTILSTGSRQAI